MNARRIKVGVVAPSSRLERSMADRVKVLAEAHFPGIELHFHPQCFFSAGHFAGTDAERAAAFVEIANDPSFDAVWFGIVMIVWLEIGFITPPVGLNLFVIQGLTPGATAARMAAIHDPSTDLVDHANTVNRCLTCGACEVRCPQGVRFTEFARGLRAELPHELAQLRREADRARSGEIRREYMRDIEDMRRDLAAIDAEAAHVVLVAEGNRLARRLPRLCRGPAAHLAAAAPLASPPCRGKEGGGGRGEAPLVQLILPRRLQRQRRSQIAKEKPPIQRPYRRRQQGLLGCSARRQTSSIHRTLDLG